MNYLILESVSLVPSGVSYMGLLSLNFSKTSFIICQSFIEWAPKYLPLLVRPDNLPKPFQIRHSNGAWWLFKILLMINNSVWVDC